MNRDKISTTITLISGILGLIATIIAVFAFTTGVYSIPALFAPTATPTFFVSMATPSVTPTRTPTPRFTPARTATHLPPFTPYPTYTPFPTATFSPQTLPTQVALLQGEITSLRQQVDAVSRAVASNPSPDVAALRTDLKSLDSRLAVIEKAVLDNPERALQFTLLGREMDNLKANNKTEMENTRQEIARVYDLTKWFVGLMFTIALSVVGLAVSNFIKKPEKPTERLWTPPKKE